MNKPIRVIEGNAKPFEAFWQVRDAAQTGGDPEIDFFGYISEYSWMDDGVTPQKFKNDLYEIGKGGPVTLRIHSGGGEIFAAAAIRAMLLEYPGYITIKILGLCASAAVGIALAGKKVLIYDTAYMMVHNPSFNFLMGSLDSATLLKFSEQLTLFKDGLLNAYQMKTGMDRDELSKLLDAETWMTANMAVELGFADEVVSDGNKSIAAEAVKELVQNYVNIPPALLNAAVNQAVVDNGQAPVESVVNALQAQRDFRQAQLATAKEKEYRGEPIMNIRELIKARAEKLTRAELLTNTADAENREFTDAERAEFETLLGAGETHGEIGVIDAQIAVINDQRERLKNAIGATPKEGEALKPEPAHVKVTSMKRDSFEALSASEKSAYIKSGGKLEE